MIKPETEWVIVPREPTPEMIAAWREKFAPWPHGNDAYTALLAAAPPAPSSTVPRPCDDDQLRIALHDAISQAITRDGRRLYSFLSDDDVKNVVLQITEGSTALDELLARHVITPSSSSVPDVVREWENPPAFVFEGQELAWMNDVGDRMAAALAEQERVKFALYEEVARTGTYREMAEADVLRQKDRATKAEATVTELRAEAVVKFESWEKRENEYHDKIEAQAAEVERLTNFGAPDIGVACEATDKAGLPGVSRMLRAVLGKWQAAESRATTAESAIEGLTETLEDEQAAHTETLRLWKTAKSALETARGALGPMLTVCEAAFKIAWGGPVLRWNALQSALAALPSPPTTTGKKA